MGIDGGTPCNCLFTTIPLFRMFSATFVCMCYMGKGGSLRVCVVVVCQTICQVGELWANVRTSV